MSHDHFQGAVMSLLWQKSPYEQEFDLERYPDIHAGNCKVADVSDSFTGESNG